jgi:hypothetical protein
VTAVSDDNVVTWLTNHGDKVTVWATTRTNWVLIGDGRFGSRNGERVEWRWHVQARNNRILEQGEGHPSKRNAVRAALRHHPRVQL